MLNYIEFLKVPSNAAMVLVGILLLVNIIGEFLEFNGKAAPEVLKMRKYFARRKKEKKATREMPETLEKVQKLLNDVNEHYSTDNITKRNDWIAGVDAKLNTIDTWKADFDKKLDKTNESTVSILIDNKRNTIIDFASRVSNKNSLVTREQFHRMFKLYDEYETLIKENNLVNGETYISYKIIKQCYENHLKNRTFAEDILWLEQEHVNNN